MKSPKLFGQPGATMAKGKAKARALQITGAPFLTSRGPGYTARVKNGFVSVKVDKTEANEEQPLFWMLSNVSPEKAQTATTRRKVKTLAPAVSAVFRIANGAALNVGNNRMAYLVEDRTIPGGAGSHYYSTTWPVLGSVRSAGGYTGHGVKDMFGRSVFATGWDTSRQTWRWGYTTKIMGITTAGGIGPTAFNGRALFECVPKVHHAGLDANLTTEVVPAHDGVDRVYYGASVYVVGPGELAGIVAVADYTDAASPSFLTLRVPPYVITSNDHGESWSRTPLSMTIPGLGSGARYNIDRLKTVATRSFFAYMGAGKSFFALHHLNGSTYGADCYLYESGSFTPVSWGFGASPYAPLPRMRLNTYGVSGIGVENDGWCIDPATFCFGPGCLALNTFHLTDPFASQGLRITRDYGATWAEIYTTTFLGAGRYSAFMCVASPYLSEELPGVIYFVAPIGGGGVEVFKTDGKFLSAALVGTFTTADWTGATMVHKGGSPYPQLPDEFGPP